MADCLGSWGLGALEGVATLLVSELVGNVILHARTDLAVRLRRLPGVVRIEVSDASPVVPVRKRYSDTATTGRGLGLVEDLAQRWGTEPTPQGKTVWFELDEQAVIPAPAVEVRIADWGDLDDWGPPAGGVTQTSSRVAGRGGRERALAGPRGRR